MSWFEMEDHGEVSSPTVCSEQGSTWLGAGCSRLCLLMRTDCTTSHGHSPSMAEDMLWLLFWPETEGPHWRLPLTRCWGVTPALSEVMTPGGPGSSWSYRQGQLTAWIGVGEQLVKVTRECLKTELGKRQTSRWDIKTRAWFACTSGDSSTCGCATGRNQAPFLGYLSTEKSSGMGNNADTCLVKMTRHDCPYFDNYVEVINRGGIHALMVFLPSCEWRAGALLRRSSLYAVWSLGFHQRHSANTAENVSWASQNIFSSG